MATRDAVIVSTARTPIGRAYKGAFNATPGATLGALSLGPAKAPHDLILLDPPYDTGAGQVALDRMLRLGWIGPATWIALETRKDEKIAIKTLVIDAERVVGKAKLTLMRLHHADEPVNL